MDFFALLVGALAVASWFILRALSKPITEIELRAVYPNPTFEFTRDCVTEILPDGRINLDVNKFIKGLCQQEA